MAFTTKGGTQWWVTDCILIKCLFNIRSGMQKGLGPCTYAATGDNLGKKRNCVVFSGELVPYKVIHLQDTNTTHA